MEVPVVARSTVCGFIVRGMNDASHLALAAHASQVAKKMAARYLRVNPAACCGVARTAQHIVLGEARLSVIKAGGAGKKNGRQVGWPDGRNSVEGEFGSLPRIARITGRNENASKSLAGTGGVA